MKFFDLVFEAIAVMIVVMCFILAVVIPILVMLPPTHVNDDTVLEMENPCKK